MWKKVECHAFKHHLKIKELAPTVSFVDVIILWDLLYYGIA